MDSLLDIKFKPKKISDYKTLLPKEYQELMEKAQKYHGKFVVNVNATALGGGVAEMLRTQIPLERDLGIDSRWLVIPPGEEFFEVTKSIHNFMQGKEGELTEQQKQKYLDHNRLVAKLLDEVGSEILIIHDPQPAAALSFMKRKPKLTVWRCHIDTTNPNTSVWNFLYPYISEYDSLIFTMKAFVHSNIPENKLFLIPPSIDPFSDKNKLIEKEKAINILNKLGVNTDKPLLTQVSRLDPWKDPKGVIDAYRIAKNQIPDLQLAFVAQMASDDPEGEIVYKEVKDYAAIDKDILFFINLKNNDLEVNAFQSASDIILQKSIREGFALTVTEAMWKKAVVIGGNVGGIKLQIKDGGNGFLVNSAEEAAGRISYCLKNKAVRKSIGSAAHNSVKSNFLIPHLLLKYFNLYNQYYK